MFASSLGAITGTDNRLAFKPAKRVIAIMVDGLGSQNLKAAAGHASFLNQAMSKTKPISCGFPSTTATSLSSFGTGLSAGQHGMVGYKVFDRQSKTSFNLLNGWNSTRKSEEWQSQATISQKAIQSGVGSFFIGPKAYNGSGFTHAIMRDADYLDGRTIADRFQIVYQLLRTNREDWLVYLYIPELDQIAHAHGVGSGKWLNAIEELDGEVRRLSQALSKSDALLVTADHGVLDVPARNHVLLDELAFDWSTVADVSGEPRVNFVYLHEQDRAAETALELQEQIGEVGLALTKDEVVSAGWYAQATATTLTRLPDVFVLATKNVAFYHRGYAPEASLDMVGQHGGLNSVELSIPLLGFGAFAN